MRLTPVKSFTNLCVSAISCPEAVNSVALYRQGTISTVRLQRRLLSCLLAPCSTVIL